jgi:hypothetical protein
MNGQIPSPNPGERRRRYLVHLIASQDESTGGRRYIARVRLWSARPNPRAKTTEHDFADECELIEVLNPLLPKGSDVRDVLGCVESLEGFLYLLQLSQTQAASLGWTYEP